jgi:hypothetical protein
MTATGFNENHLQQCALITDLWSICLIFRDMFSDFKKSTTFAFPF